MADKPLNQVTKVTDLSKVKTFLAVMDDNTIQQMSKEDMATVVGGLIKFNLPVNDELLLDFNDIKAGISLSSEDAINTPLGEKKTGTAVTFADNTGKIRLSLFGTWDGSSLYVRFLGVDSWKKIQLFGN